MKDLISKADVLETYAELYDTFEDNQFIRKELNKVYDKLNGLPYAQPEPCEDAVSREAVSSWLKQYRQDILHGKYKFSLMYIWKNLMDLPSVQPEQQWIPVGERLPDEYGEYLVTKHIIGWNCEEYVSNDIAYFDNDGFHKADMVIAYMPLPEPYKTKENEL